jgi:hypothetical protein
MTRLSAALHAVLLIVFAGAVASCGRSDIGLETSGQGGRQQAGIGETAPMLDAALSVEMGLCPCRGWGQAEARPSRDAVPRRDPPKRIPNCLLPFCYPTR